MTSERMKRRTAEILEGDCLKVMKTLPDQSVDAVITDPPYPEINRPYGVWTEDEWWLLMMRVCKQVRRVLKPTGSAVFILQANSRKIGSMRGWLFDFQSWVCREWNMVQDAYWWNMSAIPTAHCRRQYGLMRPSLKAVVWCGSESCYRNQEAVLCRQSEVSRVQNRSNEALRYFPSGMSIRRGRCLSTADERGGTTPFNLLPIGNMSGKRESVLHEARTPEKLLRWWVKYICPPEGTVIDPFLGSGTTVLAALKEGRNSVGIEVVPEYVTIARARIAKYQRNRGIVY